jgi:hypothetical protein
MVVTMNKRVPFTEQDEDAIDSVFHWRRKYNEAVDKWIRLDSLLLRIMRESEEKDKQIAFLKDLQVAQKVADREITHVVLHNEGAE